MDSLSLVITALAEGSAACARADVPVVVVSAYQELRALVVGYLAEDATLVDALARSPVSGHAFLGEELRESGPCTDPAGELSYPRPGSVPLVGARTCCDVR